MNRKPDWEALGALFSQSSKVVATKPSSAAHGDYLKYNGERIPKWLAHDLMAERAAIREYDSSMDRSDAEVETLIGLDK